MAGRIPGSGYPISVEHPGIMRQGIKTGIQLLSISIQESQTSKKHEYDNQLFHSISPCFNTINEAHEYCIHVNLSSFFRGKLGLPGQQLLIIFVIKSFPGYLVDIDD